ncbi:Gfo/Idh/MocA family oxidoreductase, partial [bacterium]|nr:Gfo/Idh/MocA family oxidoreductase [bacterium]
IHTPTVTSFGEKYGISRQHCRYEDLLTDDIDFIIINSPNDMHLEQVRLAVEAGKPCLVQKPMARNLAEAEEMVRIVRNHGVKAGIVLDEIAKPINHQIRDMIQNGIIGTPCLIHTCYTHDTYLKTPPSSDNWRYDPSRVGGAAFIQLAIHHINLIAWLLGKEVTEVSALGRCGHTVFEDETTVAVAAFSEGAVASFSASYATNGIHITVHGTQG